MDCESFIPLSQVGLRLKLRSSDKVEFSIDSSPGELLKGTVAGVTMQGSKWVSPKRLTGV